MITSRYFSIQKVLVHSRNVTWAQLPSSVPASVENVRSVSVSRKGGKLDPSHHGVVEVDADDVGCDESSEFTGVRSRVTARPVATTPSCGCPMRESCAGGWSRYRRGYFFET